MLKALMIKRKIDLRGRDLEALKAKEEEFKTRAEALAKDIEGLDEIDQETEETVAALDQERQANLGAMKALEDEIAELRGHLAEEEAKQNAGEEMPEEHREERSEKGMNIPEMNINDKRAALVQREEVKAWLGEVRTAIREKRAMNNVGLTIPEVMLGLLRENIEGYSKLYAKVNVRRIGGTGRQLVMGAMPEGVWTECCAALNELSLTFYDIELDCHKVGGFFAVCNANLEDSDVNLAGEILTALGQAIGLALDKAILYGGNAAGTKRMPYGIVSRLAEESKPDDYPATARPWADLHSTNMITVSTADSTGVTLVKKLIGATGVIKNKYATGALTWCMNETTYAKLAVELVSVNATGSVVTGIGQTMPVVGGDIVILPFMANNQIVVGYFENYLLAERAGNLFASSEHVRFLQDQTVFKGTARYDGVPVIAEAFAAIGIGNTAPSANMTFASDDVNGPVAPTAVILPATATVAVSGKLTLTPVLLPNNAATTFTWSSATTAKATVNETTGEITGVAAGTSVITATAANGLTAQCTVTVTST